MSVRTEPRLTRDADLAVLVADDRDAEGCVRSLQGRGWRVVTAIEQDAAGRLATVRGRRGRRDRRRSAVRVVRDRAEIVAGTDAIEVVPGFAVPVARSGHLIALKVLSRDDRTRPQDRVDLAALLGRADPATLDEARRALALITQRGFDRARRLAAALDSAIAEFPR